jgi:hypothetical protein
MIGPAFPALWGFVESTAAGNCAFRCKRAGEIGELAHRHGTASVASAPTEIAGCPWCARDEAGHVESIRTLIARIVVDQDTTSS